MPGPGGRVLSLPNLFVFTPKDYKSFPVLAFLPAVTPIALITLSFKYSPGPGKSYCPPSIPLSLGCALKDAEPACLRTVLDFCKNLALYYPGPRSQPTGLSLKRLTLDPKNCKL